MYRDTFCCSDGLANKNIIKQREAKVGKIIKLVKMKTKATNIANMVIIMIKDLSNIMIGNVFVVERMGWSKKIVLCGSKS